MEGKLNAGERFPELSLNLVDGGRLELPHAPDARYKVVLFYRGHW